MPYRYIPFESDACYHIYNRTTERIPLFRCAADYHFFISKMLLTSEKLHIEIPVWAALPTHFHKLAIQRGEIPISVFMHRLGLTYAIYYNNKYQRTGCLFERRYKAKLITSQEYLEKVTQYIEYNPLHHGLVSRLEEWPYTSHHSGLILNKREIRLDGEFESIDSPKPAA